MRCFEAKAATVCSSDLRQSEIDAIRTNWSLLGYESHLRDHGAEYWKHPVTHQTVYFFEG